MAYADYVNLLGDNIDTINKSTETFIATSKEVAEHNEGQNHCIKITN
jgi:hypothetical protein